MPSLSPADRGSRLPPTTRIGTVSLQVADLDRSVAFYRDVIGFEVLAPPGGSSQLARLGAPGSPHLCLELQERRGVRPVPPRGLLGLYHFAVLLPTRADLGQLLRHLVSAGTRFGSADHLISEALYLVDPDGLTVEVYRDRPRSEWSYTNGEVVAATLPLDVEAVLDAARPEPWAALPAGTSIGHVHFYIGDIARAETFYVNGLGFDKTISSMPGVLFVATGGYHHHVGLNTWRAAAPVAGADDAGLRFWELVVPDTLTAEMAADRLKSAGYDVAHLGAAWLARDAWGIGVKLVADAPA